MFQTIETEGYYNRENQWVVITMEGGRMEWRSFHDTKADAVEALQDVVASDKPEFGMVIKSPYVVAEE